MMLVLCGVVWTSVVDVVIYGSLPDVSERSTMKLLSKAIISKHGI